MDLVMGGSGLDRDCSSTVAEYLILLFSPYPLFRVTHSDGAVVHHRVSPLDRFYGPLHGDRTASPELRSTLFDKNGPCGDLVQLVFHPQIDSHCDFRILYFREVPTDGSGAHPGYFPPVEFEIDRYDPVHRDWLPSQVGALRYWSQNNAWNPEWLDVLQKASLEFWMRHFLSGKCRCPKHAKKPETNI